MEKYDQVYKPIQTVKRHLLNLYQEELLHSVHNAHLVYTDAHCLYANKNNINDKKPMVKVVTLLTTLTIG